MHFFPRECVKRPRRGRERRERKGDDDGRTRETPGQRGGELKKDRCTRQPKSHLSIPRTHTRVPADSSRETGAVE